MGDGDKSRLRVDERQAGAGSFTDGAEAPSMRPTRMPSSEPGREVADEDFLFHLYRGSELLQDERVHEAKEELEHALTYQPRDARGQDLLAVVYFRLGLFPRAIQIYETLRNQNPREPSVRLNLGLCYLKTAQAGRAREELEALVRAHPEHKRAWGYLGLAYERLGDVTRARDAFERGGHAQMAKRVAQRATVPPDDPGRGRGSSARATDPPPPMSGAALAGPAMVGGRAPTAVPIAEVQMREVSAAADVAFQELDAGELSFSLAAPSVPGADAGTAWRALEPGALGAPMSASPSTRAQGSAPANGPISAPYGAELEGSAPPAIPRIPALRPDVRVATDTMMGLQPFAQRASDAIGASAVAAVGELVRGARLPFPEAPGAVLARGLALVTTSADRPFAARLDAMRAYAGAVACAVISRRAPETREKTGEALGGLTAPLVSLTGAASVAIAPRAGHAIGAFRVEAEAVAVREERLLGFDLALTHESARLGGAGDDAPRVVVLAWPGAPSSVGGSGVVLVELGGAVGALPVTAGQSATVRREAVVGWTGRLTARAVPPGDAPAGQRGLVVFTGEGAVLVGAQA